MSHEYDQSKNSPSPYKSWLDAFEVKVLHYKFKSSCGIILFAKQVPLQCCAMDFRLYTTYVPILGKMNKLKVHEKVGSQPLPLAFHRMW